MYSKENQGRHTDANSMRSERVRHPEVVVILGMQSSRFRFFNIRPGKFGHPEVWRLTCKSSRQEKIWVAVQALEPQKARQEAENQAQGIDSWSKNPGFLGPLGVPGCPLGPLACWCKKVLIVDHDWENVDV